VLAEAPCVFTNVALAKPAQFSGDPSGPPSAHHAAKSYPARPPAPPSTSIRKSSPPHLALVPSFGIFGSANCEINFARPNPRNSRLITRNVMHQNPALFNPAPCTGSRPDCPLHPPACTRDPHIRCSVRIQCVHPPFPDATRIHVAPLPRKMPNKLVPDFLLHQGADVCNNRFRDRFGARKPTTGAQS